MITLTIIVILIIILLAIILTIGAGILAVFGDFIVAGLVIALIVKIVKMIRG
ncbi:MAG: hypothetical protein J6B01_04570 [Ruminococcus sp.]|nr:hypothetical protein [Ruminococcus sp.]